MVLLKFVLKFAHFLQMNYQYPGFFTHPIYSTENVPVYLALETQSCETSDSRGYRALPKHTAFYCIINAFII